MTHFCQILYAFYSIPQETGPVARSPFVLRVEGPFNTVCFKSSVETNPAQMHCVLQQLAICTMINCCICLLIKVVRKNFTTILNFFFPLRIVVRGQLIHPPSSAFPQIFFCSREIPSIVVNILSRITQGSIIVQNPLFHNFWSNFSFSCVFQIHCGYTQKTRATH